MAFQFNWSPLIADTSRAREMLTTALNKSPKPPIIVDDIIVTELNLGSNPPELDILEIGDLAEDRFRGIFKMTYSGDAFLTLKTRVQANPMKTYLSGKPSFASPQPLAAASGLTIPLQITLSDIILSGFVILVFSRQKGITVVFRNDPLESLKVSSTFDSIPFVREYLQKEIEAQLRVLFMDDLPAIIHRLSLRLFVPEHMSREVEVNSNHLQTSYGDQQPRPQSSHSHSSPSQRPYDRPLDDFHPFPLDTLAESHDTFSQKNLLRLAALDDSHRTLSLFSPPIKDAVFRATAGAAERGGSATDTSGTSAQGITLSSLARSHLSNPSLSSIPNSHDGISTTASYGGASIMRPSFPSSTSLSMNGSRSRTHGNKKRRKRVVNLRKAKDSANQDGPDGDSVNGSNGSHPSTPASSSAGPSSYFSGSNEREGELITPPQSPENIMRMTPRDVEGDRTVRRTNTAPGLGYTDLADATIYSQSPRPRAVPHPSATKASHQALTEKVFDGEHDTPVARNQPASSSTSTSQHNVPMQESPSVPTTFPAEKLGIHPFPLGQALPPTSNTSSSSPGSSTPYMGGGGILEQAWIMKMANEVAEKVRREREAAAARAVSPPTDMADRKGKSTIRAADPFWSEKVVDEETGAERPPPPAYAA